MAVKGKQFYHHNIGEVSECLRTFLVFFQFCSSEFSMNTTECFTKLVWHLELIALWSK